MGEAALPAAGSLSYWPQTSTSPHRPSLHMGTSRNPNVSRIKSQGVAAARSKNPILVKNVKKLQRASEAKHPAFSPSKERVKSSAYKPPIL